MMRRFLVLMGLLLASSAYAQPGAIGGGASAVGPDNAIQLSDGSGGLKAGPLIGTLATDNEVAAGYQPLDSDLTAISAQSNTGFGLAFLTLANASAARDAIEAQRTVSAINALTLGDDTAGTVTFDADVFGATNPRLEATSAGWNVAVGSFSVGGVQSLLLTDADSANTPDKLVIRDANGDFTARDVTVRNLQADAVTVTDPGDGARTLGLRDNTSACPEPAAGTTNLCSIAGDMWTRANGAAARRLGAPEILINHAVTPSIAAHNGRYVDWTAFGANTTATMTFGRYANAGAVRVIERFSAQVTFAGDVNDAGVGTVGCDIHLMVANVDVPGAVINLGSSTLRTTGTVQTVTPSSETILGKVTAGSANRMQVQFRDPADPSQCLAGSGCACTWTTAPSRLRIQIETRALE